MPEVVKLRRPATRDHLQKKPRAYRIVEVYLNTGALEAFLDAEKAVGEVHLKAASKPSPPGAEERVTEAEAARDVARAALEESAEEVLLVSIGRKAYRALEEQHPPTEKQVKEHEERLRSVKEEIRYLIPPPAHDPEAFSLALLAACATQPKMTVDEWREVLDEWNPGEASKLQSAAFEVHGQNEMVGLGKATFFGGSNGTNGS